MRIKKLQEQIAAQSAEIMLLLEQVTTINAYNTNLGSTATEGVCIQKNTLTNTLANNRGWVATDGAKINHSNTLPCHSESVLYMRYLASYRKPYQHAR